MTDRVTAIEFEIPQKSGEALCVPPARQLAALARQNAALLEDAPLTIAGVRLAEIRRRARSDISQAAVRYAQRLDLPTSTFGPSELLLVTGHQPFLFHPGIWLKHLLVDRVARDGMAALSMPVDSDAAEDVGADAPRMDGTGLRLVHETLVRADPDVPYEAVPAPPLAEWRAFLARLGAHVRTLPLPEPQAALEHFAQAARDVRAEDIGTFLTGARRRYEGRRRYAEVPVSEMSAGMEFRRFVVHVLRDAERFAAVYNHHLGAYRERSSIRTSAQPFPDLQREEGRQELPFWIIRRGRREPLSVQPTRSGIGLLAGGERVGEIPQASGPEALAGLAIRPRALTLTAFTRLCVADLFVHGVGGGRYDRVTDAVIREYFGIEPPAYAVTTATLHLPLGAYDAARERETLQRRLLELQHNPDRVLSRPTPEQQGLISEKWRLIAALDGGVLARRERREVTARIREINEELSRTLAVQREEVERQLAGLEAGAEATAAAAHRGYPYCFFSPAAVDEIIDRMLAENR